MTTITAGVTTFHSTYADSRPKWKVIKARGNDTWDCAVAEDSLDWAGTKKVFGGEEIRASIAHDKMWSNLVKAGDDWWASRKVGEVVHYHYGFGQWVRGVIVKDGKEMKMRPSALVGAWKNFDLPRFNRYGELVENYHAKKIAAGELMQPNDSNMFEGSFTRRDGIDPSTLPELSLEPTGEFDPELARLHKLHKEVVAALGDYAYDTAEEIRARIEVAKTLLGTV